MNEEIDGKETGKESESKDPRHNIDLGKRGEDAAAKFLERHGYEIIYRNWTCQAGEADIIARDGDAIVFVEVKTRSNADKGLPEEAITAAKRKKYEKIALSFLKGFEIDDTDDIQIRFDVVSIVVVSQDRAFVRHHINAFGVI